MSRRTEGRYHHEVSARFSLTLLVGCLSGCSYDFDAFSGGSGGSASTAGGMPAGTGAGGVSSTGGSGGEGAGMSTGGSGGQVGLLIPPCGDTDKFKAFPGSLWSHSEPLGFSIQGNALALDPPAPNVWSGAWLTQGESFDACAFTLALVSMTGNGYLTFDLNAEASKVVFDFDQTGTNRTLSLSAMVPDVPITVSLPGVPQALALVLQNGAVHGLYRLNNGWVYVGRVVRPSGFSSPFIAGFGADTAATFDDFGLVPIRTTDIPAN